MKQNGKLQGMVRPNLEWKVTVLSLLVWSCNLVNSAYGTKRVLGSAPVMTLIIQSIEFLALLVQFLVWLDRGLWFQLCNIYVEYVRIAFGNILFVHNFDENRIFFLIHDRRQWCNSGL